MPGMRGSRVGLKNRKDPVSSSIVSEGEAGR